MWGPVSRDSSLVGKVRLCGAVMTREAARNLAQKSVETVNATGIG
jgi:hypothetical protein